MRKIIHKVFFLWEFDQEEQWLNQMAAQGLCLVSVGFCRYEFEDSMPGEYAIRIQLLENSPRHPESENYIRFLEETGVEQVGFYWRWAYFRRKRADGDFEIFSDTASRLRQLTHALQLMLLLGGLNLYIGGYNLFLLYLWHMPIHFLGIVNLLLCVFCAVGSVKIIPKRQELKKQQTLFE